MSHGQREYKGCVGASKTKGVGQDRRSEQHCGAILVVQQSWQVLIGLLQVHCGWSYLMVQGEHGDDLRRGGEMLHL